MKSGQQYIYRRSIFRLFTTVCTQMPHMVPRPLDSRTTFPYKFINALLCDSIAPSIFGDKNNHRSHYVIFSFPLHLYFIRNPAVHSLHSALNLCSFLNCETKFHIHARQSDRL